MFGNEEWSNSLYVLQISKHSVDEISNNAKAVIPSCRFALDWKGPSGMEKPVFKRRVNLKGATRPNNHFTLHIRPSPPPSPKPSAATATTSSGQWIEQYTHMHWVPVSVRERTELYLGSACNLKTCVQVVKLFHLLAFYSHPWKLFLKCLWPILPQNL